ncbi:uncharacterized protein LOC118503220 isoform X2 [Anopheles stephensi]|uniref:uncharacterized protein LOC118503220 isoform X2 n=1 Tax=Anopheles stephensi TaxID=30069 RepID=UPI0016587B09|nr:uncharacterized protein LOC118503220 isoform X2 [Anopheles stephensi]
MAATAFYRSCCTQSEEPSSSTEFVTEEITNVTEPYISAIPYALSFSDENELVFGVVSEQAEESSYSSTTDSNHNDSFPNFATHNTSIRLRIKAPSMPSVPEYTFNELDYQFPPYNYDYESLLRDAANRSGLNESRTHTLPVVHQIGTLINPFQAPAYAPLLINPALMPRDNGGYAYGGLPKTESKDLPKFASVATLFNGIQPRVRSPTIDQSTVKDSATTAPTKSFRSKATAARSVTTTKSAKKKDSNNETW